jgi:hypothetical protein
MRNTTTGIILGLLATACAPNFASVGERLVVQRAARDHNCPAFRVKAVSLEYSDDSPSASFWVLDVCGKKRPYRLGALEAAGFATPTGGVVVADGPN